MAVGVQAGPEVQQAVEGSWSERRVAAAVLTAALPLVPLLAGFAAATFVGQALAEAGASMAVRLPSVLLAAAVVHRLGLRVARRLLPLRALLRLSLAFPHQAPDRWRVGLEAVLGDGVATRLARMRQLGPGDADAAAELAVQLAVDLSRHDTLTSGHSERVRDFAATLGRELGLSPHDLGRLRWAALLHDIGKLTVDRDVLNKPGRLTDDEWDQIRTHPANGFDLIAPLQDWLGEWALGVRHHHERFDGAGYPDGLAGTDIPLSGRIIAVVDAFDVMTSVRSYKDAIGEAAARSELVSCAGSHFDPEVVRAFLASRVRPSMPVLLLASSLPGLLAKPANQVVQLASSTTPTVASAVSAMSAVAIIAGAQLAPLPASAEPLPPAARLVAHLEEVATGSEEPGNDGARTITTAGDERRASDTDTQPEDAEALGVSGEPMDGATFEAEDIDSSTEPAWTTSAGVGRREPEPVAATGGSGTGTAGLADQAGAAEVPAARQHATEPDARGRRDDIGRPDAPRRPDDARRPDEVGRPETAGPRLRQPDSTGRPDAPRRAETPGGGGHAEAPKGPADERSTGQAPDRPSHPPKPDPAPKREDTREPDTPKGAEGPKDVGAPAAPKHPEPVGAPRMDARPTTVDAPWSASVRDPGPPAGDRAGGRKNRDD